jgi:hypothetical protein
MKGRSIRIGVQNITTNTFFYYAPLHLIVLDQETHYESIVIVSLFMRQNATALRMQEDYNEIIVIVSLFIITYFLLKFLPECMKQRFYIA